MNDWTEGLRTGFLTAIFSFWIVFLIIKFRAWDKENKIMRKGLEIAFYEPKNGNLRSDYELTDKMLQTGNLEPYELMQFTGLLDKNGKEIYEGDIISPWEGENKNGVVVIEPMATGVRGADGVWLGQIHFRTFEVEIIGNIYENPELLTTT